MARLKEGAAVLAAVLVGGILVACSSSGSTTTPNTTGTQSAATDGTSGSRGPSGTLPVGVIVPMSGPYAQVGKETVAGLQLALDKIQPGLDTKIELHVEDGAGTPSTAVSAFQKLVSQDHIKALVGPFASGVARAIGPLSARAGIAEILAGAASPGLLDDTDATMYMPNAANDHQGKVTAEYAMNKLGWKKIAIVYQDTEWGQSLVSAAKAAVSSAGATLAETVSYSAGTTNFLSAVTKLKNANVDGILFASLGTEAPALIRQAKQAGIPGDHLLAFYADQDQIAQGAGDDADGVMVLAYYDPDKPANAVMKDFTAAYKAKAGDVPPLNATTGYLIGQVIGNAVAGADDLSASAILKGIQDMKPFPTPYGQLTFKDRQIIPTLLIMQYKGSGKWQAVGTTTD